MKNSFIFFLMLLLFLQSTAAEKIYFSADTMSGKTGKEADNTTLSGNAYVKTDSMEIYADSIKLYGKDFRYISATGSIKGSNIQSKLDFSCGTLSYDRETKIATLKENVNLNDTENNVKAKAEIIEYNQNIEIAIMQINVNITQKNNVCTCAYAIYRKKAQMLNMSGNSKVIQDDDTFRAQEITLNLDTQEITLDGKVKGSVATSETTKQTEPSSKTETKSSEDVIKEFNSEQQAQAKEEEKKEEADSNQESTSNESQSQEKQDASSKKKKKSKKKN